VVVVGIVVVVVTVGIVVVVVTVVVVGVSSADSKLPEEHPAATKPIVTVITTAMNLALACLIALQEPPALPAKAALAPPPVRIIPLFSSFHN
jgi:NADH:ubiquinone oxidoreductase subunit 6 (subunit J)